MVIEVAPTVVYLNISCDVWPCWYNIELNETVIYTVATNTSVSEIENYLNSLGTYVVMIQLHIMKYVFLSL